MASQPIPLARPSTTTDADRPGANELLPVYVDLDGTLVATDMLWETMWFLVCKHPTKALTLPLLLGRGKAGFKEAIADQVEFSPELLPYRPSVISYLEAEKARGRRLILATASTQRVGLKLLLE